MPLYQTATAYQAHRAMLRTVRAHAVITSAARTTTRTTAARVVARARHAAHDAARLDTRAQDEHARAVNEYRYPFSAYVNLTRQSAAEAHADALTARDAMRDMIRSAQILYPKH